MQKKKVASLAGASALALVAVAAAALAMAPERGLAALDLDQDGQIVDAEIQQSARQRFAELDSNADGRLTGAELPRGRRGGHGGRGRRHHGSDQASNGRSAPPANDSAPQAVRADGQRSERGWASADADGDGALTLREFYARHAARAARADSNRDGTISAEELAAHRSRRDRH